MRESGADEAAVLSALAELRARLDQLEAAVGVGRAATRRLGLDMVTLGQSVSDRLRALEMREDPVQPRRAPTRRRPLPQNGPAIAAVAIAGVLAVAGAALWGYVWSSVRGAAPAAATAAALSAPIVVVGDAPSGGEAFNRAGPGEDAESGHILYGLGSQPATGSATQR
jgi:hypothetical protein